jgi:hypothetical protein
LRNDDHAKQAIMKLIQLAVCCLLIAHLLALSAYFYNKKMEVVLISDS